ncbi:MAG: hypothetical protein ACOXZI_06660 [Candidatus Cryptobacteroides sp.]|jgi:hypothetical protein
MKRKALLITLMLSLLTLCGCDKKGKTPDDPDEIKSEITSENAAPGGFNDEGTASWDE